jgi:GEVED domain
VISTDTTGYCYKQFIIKIKIMKKIYSLLLFILCFSVSSFAQTATIGSGTTATTSTGSDPIDGYYESFRYQVVYTAAELTAAGLVANDILTGLGFSIAGDYGGGNLLGYTIKIGHTSATNSASHNTDATVIVKNPFNYNPTVTTAGSFDMVTFNSNFTWNGTSNILVEICSDGPNAYTSPYGSVRTIAATTTNGSRYYRVDGDVSCNEITTDVNSNKPQIRFNYTPGTPPSCLFPSGVANSAITATTANHTWVAPSPAPAVGYEWAVTTSSTAPASGAPTTSLTASSTGLTANTTYYLHVRSNCGAGSFSTWVTSASFFTGYCTPAPSSVDGNGITNVMFGTINNTTGAEPTNYGNYSAQSSSHQQGSTVPVSITYQTGYTYGTKIWVDYNDDLDFDDAGELAYTGLSAAPNPTTLAASISIPGSAPIGPHRMRIGGTDEDTGGDPCYTGVYGSYEDYTINIIAGMPCSGAPAGAVVAPTSTILCGTGGANLTATTTSTGTGITYQWESSPAGANIWTAISGATSNAYSATAVTSSTDYRCILTCSGSSTTSSTATISITNAPVNDIACSSTALVLDGATVCGNTTCATSVGDPAFSQSVPNNTTWYSFTPATTGIYEVSLSRPAGVTTGLLNGWLGIYTATGTCPSLTFTEIATTVARNFDLPVAANFSFATPSLTAGTTYYFMIDGVSGAVGQYCIEVNTPPAPPSCTTNSTPANGATGVAFTPNIVLTWNAAAGASNYDVYIGTTNPPTNLIGNFPGPTLNVTGAVGSTTYYWYVVPRNAGGAATGCASSVTSFQTVLTCDAPASVATNSLTSTSVNITFASPGTSFIVEYGPTGFTPGTGATAGGGSVITGSASPIAISGLTPLTPYQVYVRQDCSSTVGGFSPNSTVVAFTTLGAPPANDNATGAIPLTLGAACTGAPYTNVNATAGATEPYPSCSGVKNAPVWFSFVAPPSGTARVTTDFAGGTFSDSKVAIFSATNPADYSTFVINSCDDDGGSTNGNMSVVYTAGLIPGNTYYIAVDKYLSSTTNGTFCIEVDEINTSMLAATNTCASTYQTPFVASGSAPYSGKIPLMDANSRLIALVTQPLGTSAANFSVAQNINTGAVRTAANGTPYLDRNFRIVSTQTNVEVQLFFLLSELTALSAVDNTVNLTNLGGTRQSGAGEACQNNFNPSNGSNAVFSQTGNTTSNGVAFISFITPSFSNFYLHKQSSVLPIRIDYITGRKNGSVNNLDWKVTCTNSPTVELTLERSGNGNDFKAINIQNETQARCDQPFAYTDASPLQGKNYYRVKVVGVDGIATSSRVVTLLNTDKGFELISIAPNPVNEASKLNIASAKADRVTVTIVDKNGRIASTSQVVLVAGSNTIPLASARLAAGSYHVIVTNQDGERKNLSFVKQ